MRVIITGGTGLIGRSLVELLAHGGYEIVVLSRNATQATQMFHRQGLTNIQTVRWDAQTAQGWGELINRESAIINLAGASPPPIGAGRRRTGRVSWRAVCALGRR